MDSSTVQLTDNRRLEKTAHSRVERGYVHREKSRTSCFILGQQLEFCYKIRSVTKKCH